jgi:gluconate 2-dehydrogenase alpha chain
MAIKKDKVDVVLVGFGWTGAILGQELIDSGLKILALERGEMRDTATDAVYPKVLDELTYSIRGKLYQDLSKETVTVRHNIKEEAVPYRMHGSFNLGDGVGGAGFHWNGQTHRNLPEELELRTRYETRYGKDFIPQDMTVQDFGVTYADLEPHFGRFEEVCGTAGKAGNLNGKIVGGGNPFEGPRAKEYPTPPLPDTYAGDLFRKAVVETGFHPFPMPASNASVPYTNPYGVRLGPCNFCGFCENYGCYMYSKASPQTTIMPVLMKKPNFELRTHSYVTKVNLSSDGKRAVGVTYIDAQGQEVEQPADLVILTAYQMHNVRLLLLSGIGKPYDPVSGEGQVGRNYAYQKTGGIGLLMPKGTQFNPFVGAGSYGVCMDDLNGDQFDHGPLGFVGGAKVSHGRTGGRPIGQAGPTPGAPAWGSGWKAGMQDAYQRSMGIGMSGSVMPYRDAYLSLDPNYKDAHGLPLIRITFDWHDNEINMINYVGQRMTEVAKAMKPEKYFWGPQKKGMHWDTRVYQSTHTTGGAIMGRTPGDSVVNRYLQSWDVPNVFVLTASAFPQNMGYNPTGLVGALAYWAAKAIREQYLKNPGPLVQA